MAFLVCEVEHRKFHLCQELRGQPRRTNSWLRQMPHVAWPVYVIIVHMFHSFLLGGALFEMPFGSSSKLAKVLLYIFSPLPGSA